MFIRHIFICGLELNLLESNPVERELRRGTSSLKTEKWISAVAICIGKSFALKILPLTPLDGIF